MRITSILTAGILTSVAGAGLACELPKLAVVPPKDEIAGKEAAITADVNRYFTEMQAYSACVQAELTAAGGDSAPDTVKRVLIARNNTAVAEAQFMMKLYNETMGVPAAGAAPAAPAAR